MFRERAVFEYDKSSLVVWAIIMANGDEKKNRNIDPLQFNPWRHMFKEHDNASGERVNGVNDDIGVKAEKAFAMMKKTFTK